MKTRMIRFEPTSLSPLGAEDSAIADRLAAKRDEEIDTEEIPELTDEQLRNAVRGRFYRPFKEQITARVDADVLEWLRSGGKGYQARLNAILRREMITALARRLA